ncbi:MAG TPA: glycosidase, partial [Thermoanaerobacterales bacterium]|nr:glycosidase [Thermoanaerobacterales bacterium]
RFFESDAVLLEADLKSHEDQGIKPDWVDRLVTPVFEDYDMAMACFRRHPFEDIIGNILVSPVIAALYETKFKDSLSGVFAIAHDLVEEFCSEFDQNSEYLGGYGINPWIITTALKWGKRICEVNFGAKLSPVSLGKKYVVTKEMLRVLFQCIKRDEDVWLKDSQIIKTLDVYGGEYKDIPLKVDYCYKEFLDSFIEGICHYNNLLQKIFNEDMLQHIESMIKPNVFPNYVPKVWAQITYEVILACNFNSEILPEDMLEVLLAIYYGMTASLIKEMDETKKVLGDLNIDADTVISAQIEAAYKKTMMAFIENKLIFLKNWRQKVDETSPVLTPLDYLEFIPGVPIVLPKKLRGTGQRQVMTGEVFKRLQRKYNNAFKAFLRTLNLDYNLPSEVIGRRLTEFMAELENTINGLCPGDLYSVEGTGDVVEYIFRIIPHNKVLAVKWQILRKLLYEYPPGNLILRMGFRSLRELLENMDEREILTLASFTEDKDYFDRIFYWLLLFQNCQA